MVKKQYVCRNCRRFTTEKECPICKSTDLSASWKGLVIIIDPNESEIAKSLGIGTPGKYALFVG
ncbi:MAG: transcription elongation factor subunit Spt4 [Candidatus Aenigmarchaeota archaeon]|nr:transcription elongation factor subunit Spt4 [Candidatus Aenigmarchaeota archaeon]